MNRSARSFCLSSSRRLRRTSLLLSCAAAALAVPASRADAQAFQGNISSSSGSVSRASGQGTETITIGSGTATINWSPFDTQTATSIDFLPQGNTATFLGTPGLGDFTVLNRIIPVDPSRPVLLNGHVISQLQDTSQNVTTGGRVWFFSPGGIVVGASAVFDVGSLLLTANDPVSWNPSSGGFTGSFSAGAGSAASVTLQPGAQINALNEGSYVAILAPRVVQSGNVAVNGAAAYVAAEAATLTMNQGLFDIVVDVGTADPNGIVHTGSTGGPLSGSNENHHIYMVAVPKNEALTMLLSGNVGFGSATNAAFDGSDIVLSAGYGVDETETARNFVAASPGAASIQIDDATFLSPVDAHAATAITAIASTGALDFLQDTHLEANNVTVGATGEQTLDATFLEILALDQQAGTGGSALIFADSGAQVSVGFLIALADAIGGNGSSATGGSVNLVADGGSISSDFTYMSADGFGNLAAESEGAVDGQGGSVNVAAVNGGSAEFGTLMLDAKGYGQSSADNASGIGGSGNGGIITVNADSGGSIAVDGDLAILTEGRGGNMFAAGEQGGAGTGGQIYLTVGDGTMDVGGDLSLSADALGGTLGAGGTGGTGGAATGGIARIHAYGPGSVTIGGSSTIIANATGGSGQAGGSALGGNAGADGTAGTIDLGSTITIAATGTGGSATVGFGGAGGDGKGGTGYIEALASEANNQFAASAATITGGNASIDVSGFGGSGGAGNGDNLAAGAGGSGTGGAYQGFIASGGAFAAAQAGGAILELGNVTLTSNGTGGAGGDGGGGQTGGAGGGGIAGSTQAGEYGSDAQAGGSATFGNVVMQASGFGGAGGAGPAGEGAGGLAEGGAAYFLSRLDTQASSLILTTTAAGGDGSVGGSATGGWAEVGAYENADLTVTGGADLDATASGGAGSSGAGGAATGGHAFLHADNGSSIAIGGLAELYADADGGTGAPGGAGDGGSAQIDVADGAALDAGEIYVEVLGIGGNGRDGADAAGGHGSGGSSDITVGGTLTADRLDAYARGWGGDGSAGTTAGAGGNATGGDSNLEVYPEGAVTIAEMALLNSSAFAGDGASGGDAQGGNSELSVEGSFAAGELQVTAQGFGGVGSVTTGGTARGGTSLVEIDGGSATFGTLFLLNGAIGGGGVSAGGDSFAGWSGIHLFDASATTTNGILLDAHAEGGLASAGAAGGSSGGDAVIDLWGSSFAAADVTLDVSGSNGGDATLDLYGSSLTARALRLDASGDASGGSASLYAGTASGNSSITTDALTASADGDSAGSVFVSISGDTSASLGTVSLSALGEAGSGSVGIAVGGSSEIGEVASIGPAASGDSVLEALGLAMTSSGAVEIFGFGGSGIDVAASMSVTAPQVLLQSDGGGVIEANHLSVDAGTLANNFALAADLISLFSDFDLDVGDLSAGTAITLSAGGKLTAGSLDAGEAIALSAQGDLSALDLAAASVEASAGGDLSVRNITADLVGLEAGGMAVIDGLVSAPEISVTSADLQIGDQGQLGEAGVTELLTLNAITHGLPVVIGGDGVIAPEVLSTQQTAGQYQLTQDEAEKIESDSIIFNANAASDAPPSEVVINDLTILGSAGGGTSSVQLNTSGNVRIQGDVAYIEAAAGDALSIFAGDRLEVITPDGSIRMVGPDGELAGTLSLQSANIVVTDSALAEMLAQNPNFEGRNAALATNNGPVNPAGYLEARGIQLLTTGNIFIQNTGTATQFAGLTVGGGGLLIGKYSVATAMDGTQTFSFVGTLNTADEVLFFDFTIAVESNVTLRTYSYAGGVNGQGQTIPAGGFDPILALFTAAGQLIDQNDDGGSNVPADPTTQAHFDTYLQATLPAGSYTVAVSVFSNFANGPTLEDGFEGGGNFNGRTPNFAFDVIGADQATGPGATGPITMVGFGRMQNEDGSFTGGAGFFSAVDFSLGNVEYAPGSTFNGFAIGEPLPPPEVPPEEPPQQPSLPDQATGQGAILGPIQFGDFALIDFGEELFGGGTIGWIDEDGDGDDSGETRMGIPLSNAVSNRGGASPRGLDDAVISGGDASLWNGADDEDEDEDEPTGDSKE